MGKFKSLFLATVFSVLVLSSSVWAEESARPSSNTPQSAPEETGSNVSSTSPSRGQQKQPSSEEVRQMMQQAMGSLSDIMGLMMEGMAKTLAKPELAENYATFTRHYYEALIARGFTEEQALKIVISDGFPTLGGKT